MDCIELYIEKTTQGECGVHVPALKGCFFRAASDSEARQKAVAECQKYIEWCQKHSITAPQVDGKLMATVREMIVGSPLWISGNPAALFTPDRIAPQDRNIEETFAIINAVIDEIGRLIKPICYGELSFSPDSQQRSILNTLYHVVNCIWWYCSRLDDDLPFPEDCPDEVLAKLDFMAEFAKGWLLNLPPEKREIIVVPHRFCTSDPNEQWCMGKVLRRQAEHAIEHRHHLIEKLKSLGNK